MLLRECAKIHFVLYSNIIAMNACLRGHMWNKSLLLAYIQCDSDITCAAFFHLSSRLDDRQFSPSNLTCAFFPGIHCLEKEYNVRARHYLNSSHNWSQKQETLEQFLAQLFNSWKYDPLFFSHYLGFSRNDYWQQNVTAEATDKKWLHIPNKPGIFMRSLRSWTVTICTYRYSPRKNIFCQVQRVALCSENNFPIQTSLMNLTS